MNYEQELIEQGLCPDLVMINTEDGPAAARCMGPIVEVTVPPDPRYGEIEPETVAFACEGHSAERLGWRALSETDKMSWERRQEYGY